MDKYIIYLYISAWILVMPKSYSRGKLQKRETVFIGFIKCCRGASHITILHHKSQIDYVTRALGTFARFKNVTFSGKLTHLPGIFFFIFVLENGIFVRVKKSPFALKTKKNILLKSAN